MPSNRTLAPERLCFASRANGSRDPDQLSRGAKTLTSLALSCNECSALAAPYASQMTSPAPSASVGRGNGTETWVAGHGDSSSVATDFPLWPLMVSSARLLLYFNQATGGLASLRRTVWAQTQRKTAPGVGDQKRVACYVVFGLIEDCGFRL